MFGERKKYNFIGEGSYLKFFALTIIFSITFFLVFLDNSKRSQTTISLMFIPKNETVALQIGYILENAKHLPGTLAFYDRMIISKKDLKDRYALMDPDIRKKNWNKIMKSQQEKSGSVITLTFYAINKNDSQILARQSAKTLIDVMSSYYDFNSELDVRIIEGPITSVKARNWPLLIIISLIAGCLFSYSLLTISEKFGALILSTFFRVKTKFNSSDEVYQKNNEKPTEQVFAKKSVLEKVNSSKAPDNLPIFAESEIKNSPFYGGFCEEKLPTEKNEKSDISFEPTEEEIKKRLNQLLRGDM